MQMNKLKTSSQDFVFTVCAANLRRISLKIVYLFEIFVEVPRFFFALFRFLIPHSPASQSSLFRFNNLCTFHVRKTNLRDRGRIRIFNFNDFRAEIVTGCGRNCPNSRWKRAQDYKWKNRNIHRW